MTQRKIQLEQLAITSTAGGNGTLPANIAPEINAQTGTSYTLVLTDAGKHITRNNAAASTQTLPQDSDVGIPVGTIIPISNIGAGLVTFQAGTGATVFGMTSIAQYEKAEITKIDTNSWLVNSFRRVSSGQVNATATKTGAYTLTSNDYLCLADSTSSAFTITLPTAVGVTGQTYIIKDWKGTSMTNNITVATTSSQTIDSASTALLNIPYISYTIVSDGANWSIV